MPSTTLLHLTPCTSAAASLRVGLGNQPHQPVVALPDLYGLGPLDDTDRRAAFWRGWLAGYPEMDVPDADPEVPFAAWAALADRLDAHPVSAIAVWTTASGNDQTFLRMACQRLQARDVALYEVRVQAAYGVESMAMHTPPALAAHAAQAAPITTAERQAYGAGFASIAAATGLRESDAAGVLQLRDVACHDPAVLTQCPRLWRPAAWLVGVVCGASDPRNPLSDTFVAGRLAHLIQSGRIEADRRGAGLRQTQVRRARGQ